MRTPPSTNVGAASVPTGASSAATMIGAKADSTVRNVAGVGVMTSAGSPPPNVPGGGVTVVPGGVTTVPGGVTPGAAELIVPFVLNVGTQHELASAYWFAFVPAKV